MKSLPAQIMDLTCLKAVVKDLKLNILPSRFEKAQQPDQNTIQLCFRNINSTFWIEISWQPEIPRIYFIKKPSNVGAKSTLSKQLSYGLRYMALTMIEQKGFERIIKFSFAKNPSGEPYKYLIVELMGRHSNLIFLDEFQKIIAIGKQVKNNQTRFRCLTTGEIYEPPPFLKGEIPNIKENFEDWYMKLNIAPKSFKQSLINTYQGVSPALVKQIIDKSELERDDIQEEYLNDISLKDLKNIYKSWKLWIKSLESNEFWFFSKSKEEYCVWGSEKEAKIKGKPIIYELEKYYYDFTISKKFYQALTSTELKILKQINSEIRNLKSQKSLYQNSTNFIEPKEEADQILSKGKLTKEDINLSQKLYKKSKKLKRAINKIEERINFYELRLKKLYDYQFDLENIESNYKNDVKTSLILISEISQEFNETFAIKSHKKRLRRNETRSKPLEILSPSGLTIQIGRNCTQNELLCFKLSRKGDTWFHAQECPGSHVILKTSLAFANEEDIQTSADIAAFFSKGKGNNLFPVTYTKTKNLNKISGLQPGTVSIKDGQIIWGKPARGEDYIKKNAKVYNSEVL
tara:strand:+ start:1179 stop:2903 length:1725 start_codon:yes stop_codon:yes gene_type:complete